MTWQAALDAGNQAKRREYAKRLNRTARLYQSDPRALVETIARRAGLHPKTIVRHRRVLRGQGRL